MNVIPPVTGNALKGPLSIFCAQFDFFRSKPLVDLPSKIVGSNVTLISIASLNSKILLYSSSESFENDTLHKVD